jgi:hypothetical protein
MANKPRNGVEVEVGSREGQTVELILPDGVEAVYVRMGSKTYYLDDSTGEGIAECFHVSTSPPPPHKD